MLAKSFQKQGDQYAAYFADYTLTEVTTEDAAPARYFKLRKPGHGNAEGVDLIFTGGPDVAERIIITGDLSPNDNDGCLTGAGYGLRWFLGRTDYEHLCSKFMRKVWVPELALEWLQATLEDAKEELATDDGDVSGAVHLIEQLEEAIQGTGSDPEQGVTRSGESFWDWYYSVFDDPPDDSSRLAHGYPSREAALLCVIQGVFARLYWASKPPPEFAPLTLSGAGARAHEEAIAAVLGDANRAMARRMMGG